MRYSLITILAAATLIASNALAKQQDVPLPHPQVDELLECTEPFCLWVQPQICVTDNAPAVCKETVSVNWRSEDPLNACLAFDEQVLACWQAEANGSWLGELTWFGDEILVLFTVDESDLTASGEWRERPRRTSRQQFLNSIDVLASTEMQIQSLFPKARRRLGSPWSVF